MSVCVLCSRSLVNRDLLDKAVSTVSTIPEGSPVFAGVVAAASSTAVPFESALDIVRSCALPFRAGDLFVMQAVVDFATNPS